jgi:hypothetical protein
MGGIFDGASALPTAAVLGDERAIVDDPYPGIVGTDVNRLSEEPMRDRIVGVQHDTSLFAHDDYLDPLGVEGVLRQRSQPGPLDEQARRGPLAGRGVQVSTAA